MAVISAKESIPDTTKGVNNMRFANYNTTTGSYQKLRSTSSVTRTFDANGKMTPAIELPASANPIAISRPFNLIGPVRTGLKSGDFIPSENPHYHIFARTFLINTAIRNGTYIPYDPLNISINFPIPHIVDFFYN